MDLIHFLLNLAGLLLWQTWRSLAFARLTRPSALALSSVVNRAESPRAHRWFYLAGLVGLLLLRSVFYWQIGPAADWTPKLELGAIVLSFRSDLLGRAMLYSVVSFGLTVSVFYLWLLLLSLANRATSDTDPMQRLVRLHLGRFERWPAAVKLVCPWLLAALVWSASSTWLVRLGVLPPPKSSYHLLQQAAVVGLAPYLAWKFLIVGLLFFHLPNTYLYLGNVPFWTFVSTTARNLLVPLRFLPLQVSKLDFAPLVGIALILLLAEFGAKGLTLLYQRLPL